jgi:hypothetical protein
MKSEPVWPARNRGLTRARDHDVFGLQVAVHDAECVRGSHTIRNLAGEVDGFAYPERAAIEHGPQGLALHQLGDDIGAAGIGADVVNGDDIGMIQRRARARFLFKASAAGGVTGDVCRQDFYRDRAVQTFVTRTPDLAHAALAQLVEDLIIIRRLPGAGGWG